MVFSRKPIANDAVDAEWRRLAAKLAAYKRIHGHCNVPLPNADDPELGIWVQRQRAARFSNTLGRDKLRQLKRLHFIWDVPRFQAIKANPQHARREAARKRRLEHERLRRSETPTIDEMAVDTRRARRDLQRRVDIHLAEKKSLDFDALCATRASLKAQAVSARLLKQAVRAEKEAKKALERSELASARLARLAFKAAEKLRIREMSARQRADATKREIQLKASRGTASKRNREAEAQFRKRRAIEERLADRVAEIALAAQEGKEPD